MNRAIKRPAPHPTRRAGLRSRSWRAAAAWPGGLLLGGVLLGGLVAPAPARAGDFGAAYCTAHQGSVVTRMPAYGTNNPNPLTLAGERAFCEWTSRKDGSKISTLLTTLVAAKPSLAVEAYRAQVKFNGSGCQGSPGSCYCSQLGGTDLFGGVNAAGGGWVNTADSNDVLDACIFPDLSSVDSYGLFYHSAGIVRDRNLTKIFRYKGP